MGADLLEPSADPPPEPKAEREPEREPLKVVIGRTYVRMPTLRLLLPLRE